MDITDYLTGIGFQPVIQIDEDGKFIDYNYLEREGLYFELHDDKMLFVWHDITNPIIAKTYTKDNDFEIKLQIQKLTYKTNCK